MHGGRRNETPCCSCGSIYELGSGFQLFRINDLEMVDQNSGSWNHISSWLHRVEALRDAA